jgi:CheY-like chemotaxis protein
MANNADAYGQRNGSNGGVPRRRILVVEGDEPLQMLMSEMLLEAGWEPHVSNDGERALEAVRTGDVFDAVIFDVQTALIEPRTFLRRLRKLAPDTPVVALSGHGAKSIRRVLRVDGVVLSPPESLSMIQELQSVLNAR